MPALIAERRLGHRDLGLVRILRARGRLAAVHATAADHHGQRPRDHDSHSISHDDSCVEMMHTALVDLDEPARTPRRSAPWIFPWIAILGRRRAAATRRLAA